MTHANLRINSGYFAFTKDIFKYIRRGEELVSQPFQRLIREKRLVAYEYDGFFQAMDTFKDRQLLESLLAAGNAPWEVWKEAPGGPHMASQNGRGTPRGQKSRTGIR